MKPHPLYSLVLASLPALALHADSTVVFNEIQYHPRGDEASLEWVELHNQMGVDMDISGWSLANGVFYTFPEGTIVPGGGYIVVATNPAALAATTGYAGALGPFTGRLDNSGERLELHNNSFRLMDSLRYRDEDGWPVSADGSGRSLAKRAPDLASEPAASWTLSAEEGGTPGAPNFNPSTGGGSLPAGLVSFWNLDGGGPIADDIADGNHGELGSGARRVAGLVGTGAIDFDNTANAYIDLGAGTSNNFSTTTGITIEAVIRPEWSGAAGDYDEILRKEDGSQRILFGFQNDASTANRDVPISPAGQPVLSFGLNVGGTYSELDMPLDGANGRPTLASLKDGAAHHVACTYDSATGRKRIFVDGALAFESLLGAGNLIASGGASTAYIGNMSGRGEPFSGVIDEVAFWSTALSSGTIAAHSAAVAAGRGYFDEGSAGGAPVRINEIFAPSGASGWIELVNTGASAVALDGFVLESSGLAGAGEYVFPSQSLAGGAFLVLTEATLGYEFVAGNKLFLFTPAMSSLVDAEEVKDGLRGRYPQGLGELLWPASPTPGAPNTFTFHEDVVINEIMYHPRPREGRPPTVEETTFVPIDATWRYDDSGAGYASTVWAQPGFNDGGWDEGEALLYVEDAELPGPKSTPLTLGPLVFYFRSEFEFTGDPATADLRIRPVIDDGAVFYLNGVEVYRLNMPAAPAPITPSTPAETGVSDATFTGPFAIPTGSLVAGTNVLAVEVHQSTANSSDVVLGVELFATVTTDPGRPFSSPPLSYVELYNRGASAVDLSGWSLEDAIEWIFPAGTLLGAGEYIVVAEDRALLANLHQGARIVGDFTGSLANSTERILLRDAARNPADEVTYHDGDRWPSGADGRGSSLELRDPWADNTSAEAWAASDESARTSWRTYTYEEVATANIGPTQWNEFCMGLLDDGEVLIDDISVVESPGGAEVQFVSNGSFTGGTAPWRLIGNHRHSEVVPDPQSPGNPVLRLVATGATEHMHNQAQITLAGGETTVNGRTYRVSFRARWVTGSNQLHTRLYFNRVPETTLIDVPAANGTPGAQNTRLAANIGPTFTEFRHEPVVPGSGEDVTVRARASDPDGVASARLWYSVDGGTWQSRSMSAASGGAYAATIPGQAAGRTVQFYVEGTDGDGAVATFPRRGRDARALFRVEDGQADLSDKHNFRIVMTPEDASFLHTPVQVMSNDRIGCTVIYDEREVFYDLGVRLKGSERGRNQAGRVGFNVAFHRDQLFRGVHDGIAIDRSGGYGFGTNNGQDEILVKHMIQHAGGIPGSYDDLIHAITPQSRHTGPALLQMARVGSLFLDSQYENGADGTVFEFELIYYPLTVDGATGLKLPEPDSVLGVDIADHGDDKEVYRWNFTPTNNRDKDDYEGLIRLCKAFSLSGTALEQQVSEVADVDEWMRVFAMQTLCGIGDAYSRGNNHNLRIYIRPDNIALAFPWDWDFAFQQSTSSSLVGNQNIADVINRPRFLHLYYGHLLDIIESTYNTTYMSRWTGHYGSLARETSNFNSALNYINARRSFVLSNLPAQVTFAITTNGGAGFTVDTPSVTLAGNAWIDVHSVGVAGVAQGVSYAWTGVSTWTLTAPLAPGINDLNVLGFDFDGNLVASDRIGVTSTFDPPDPVLTSVLPAAAAAGATVEVAGSGFLPGLSVRFGSIPSPSVTVTSPTRAAAIVPAVTPGAMNVRARNLGSADSNAIAFTVLTSPEVFVRGDFNLDGLVDVSDPVRLLFHLFHEAPAMCLDAGDATDDEQLNLTDVTFILNLLFLNGTIPASPFPEPGGDPTGAGALDCAAGL